MHFLAHTTPVPLRIFVHILMLDQLHTRAKLFGAQLTLDRARLEPVCRPHVLVQLLQRPVLFLLCRFSRTTGDARLRLAGGRCYLFRLANFTYDRFVEIEYFSI
uniref:Uncharacterized protein n=1 Tax=Anopheles christyi TaxID=43041 RepID=A0A182KHT2_9DIPT